MIGRIAEVKYIGTESEVLPLAEKINMVLDLIFPLVGARRKEV